MHKNDFETIQKTTVRQYMNTWMTETKINELKSSSYDRKEQVLENQVYPYIGDLQVSNLTTSDIQSMINSLSKKYSYSTIKKAYEAVNACMKLAIIKRDIQYNPALGVTLPTNIQKSEGEIIFFNESEIKLITEEAVRKYNNDIPIYRLGYAVLFLLNTGLRIGEALALQWRDIDFINKTVFIKKNVKLVKNRDSKQETKYILKEQNNPKTKKSTRTVPLNANAINALLQLKTVTGNHQHVFATKTGKIINPRNIDRMFRNILTQCKLPLCGLHSLRHTFASILFKNGVDVKTVSEILGHSDVSITYNTYVHLIQEQKIKAVELINI